MLNYFNFKFLEDHVVLTNDFGKYAFLSKSDFRLFLQNGLPPDLDVYKLLRDRFFLFDDHTEQFLAKTKEAMRNSKQYIFYGTVLHIFVVTNHCNGNCVYCQAQNVIPGKRGFMSKEIAERSVDIALSAPNKNLTFEFQGGEPLMNFEIIKHIVHYTEANKRDKTISFSLVSNLTLMTEEIMRFLVEHGVSISASLDGPANLHDQNRPLLEGSGTYSNTIKQIERIRIAHGDINAIETTTRASLSYPKEIIDTYILHGFNSVFIRPLTPLGYAAGNWDAIGYTADEFNQFYRAALKYIIDLNKSGKLFIENHAAIFLRKILGGYGENYMELRSPCGASVGQMAYYFDGNIFTCDEGRMLAEMGNEAFRIGNVFSSTYDSIMNSQCCKATCAASVLETLPSCCDCIYQPYCGVCPVLNLASEDDVFTKSPFGYRCKIYRGMLDAIFEILKRNNAEEMEILKGWI